MNDRHRPRRKRGRILAIALGASVAIHLAALPFLRVAATARPAPLPKIISISYASTPRPVAPPPSTPKPLPRFTPPPLVRATQPPLASLPRHADAIAPPHARAVSQNSSREGGARAVARGAGPPARDPQSGPPGTGYHSPAEPPGDPSVPSPSSDATAAATEPACPGKAHDARVVDAVTPERPAIAAEEGALGRVQVRVDLAPTGAVISASVYVSSGNAALDGAAVEAARRSTYEAAGDGCRAIAGSYVFTVDYSE